MRDDIRGPLTSLYHVMYSCRGYGNGRFVEYLQNIDYLQIYSRAPIYNRRWGVI
ncbi:hypothetical protein BDW75DRAFT_226066 [Aspergillus navahoensis]